MFTQQWDVCKNIHFFLGLGLLNPVNLVTDIPESHKIQISDYFGNPQILAPL